MKIRRMLATAVAAAVTTPVLLLSATSAFAADTVPAGQAQDQKPKPTPAELEKLKKAADEAKTAYDTAVTKHAAAQKYADDYLKDDSPARKHLAELKKEAKDAEAASDAADAVLKTAQEDLAKLPADAPEADVIKAKDAVTKAQGKADLAAKAEMEAKRTLAFTEGGLYKGYMDAKMKADTAAGEVTKAKKTYDDAVKAYDKAKAQAGIPDPTKPPVDPTKPPVDPTKPPVDPTKPPVDDDCKVDAKLSTALVGLPSKVVAGTTVNFTLRVTNGTGKKIDEVKPFAVV
ncbi:hypothetical protein [Streptomyces sp. NPDC048442]|uniref:hypothetical protein n=1 Tax=Streptomyces sp. NPDC048442 TaxID=3154823 RepID=UPI0034364CF3